MFPGLSNNLTLTWNEDDEETGVSAPLEVWIAQIILVLPLNIQSAVMDNVVGEVMRLNELDEEINTDINIDLGEDDANSA